MAPVIEAEDDEVSYAVGCVTLFGLMALLVHPFLANWAFDGDPTWSPDSHWIAYTKRLDNHLHAIFVYDVENMEGHQLTDGLSDARFPAFSRDGKYLFFAASTNLALGTGWLDMTSMERQIRWSLYVAILDKDQKSPFATHERTSSSGWKP